MYFPRWNYAFIYVCYNYNKAIRRLIATSYSIKPIYWDDKKKWIERASPKFEEINFILTKITSKLGKILTHAKDNAIDPIVDYVLLELKKDRNYEQHSNRVNLFDTLDKYIEEKVPFVYKDQVKDYKTLKKHLAVSKKQSSQSVTFCNLNLKFYNELMNNLFYEAVKPAGTVGIVTNLAGKIVRLLKGFVNYQMYRGIIPSIDLKCFKVIEEETDAIYLTKKKLDKIYKLKLSDDDELEQIRDIFIDGCYTRLRYSDLSSLNKEHIDLVNGNINIKQCKVHKALVIPTIDYIPKILKKYKFELPKISAYRFNIRLKELGEKIKLTQNVEIVRKKGNIRITEVCKKYELMSSHTCRCLFCTNMYFSGFPSEKLMKISGHKSPDRSLSKLYPISKDPFCQFLELIIYLNFVPCVHLA